MQNTVAFSKKKKEIVKSHSNYRIINFHSTRISYHQCREKKIWKNKGTIPEKKSSDKTSEEYEIKTSKTYKYGKLMMQSHRP